MNARCSQLFRYAIIAVLAVSMFRLPIAALAQDGVDGNAYVSPTFGYTLEWDDDIWEVSDATSGDSYDSLVLNSDGATLYVESLFFYRGRADRCIDGELAALASQAGVDEFEPALDDNDEPIEDIDRESATGVYVLPESDENDETIIYLHCQTLIEGEAVLVATGFLYPETMDEYGPAIEDVLNSIDTDNVSSEEASGGDLEQTIRRTDQDVTGFWEGIFEDLGEDWVNPKFISFDEPIETACGDADPGAVGPFYCGGDQTVYLDQRAISGEMLGYGTIIIQVMLAHEIGHHVQELLGLDGCTLSACGPEGESLAIELQADCLAGAWMKDAAGRDFVTETDLKRVQTGVIEYFGDPPGTRSDDPEAHGSGEVRFAMFMAGYTQGLAACGVDLSQE